MRLIAQDVLGQECIIQTVDGIPPVLYRYIGRQSFADDVTQEGRLRLGTLYGYLKSEGHNEAQHDPNEGLIAVMDKDFQGVLDAPVGFYITSTDRWITCLSAELSSDRLKEFGSEAVLEIQTKPFVEAVAVEMARWSPIGALDRVRYISDSMHSLKNRTTEERMAHTYKTRNYAQQKEWRLCFEAHFANANSIKFQRDFGRFGNRSAFNTRNFWEEARTNGASGTLLTPRVIQSPAIAAAVRDVTHRVTQ